ncbi:30S ribosomal protein S21 [Anaeromyxobacter sp. PSR-1]|uniref:30S ribosomal protein S21 n=1 Tax=Anaeromyxobacter sp. PSR-1 TaxID=1300915 RepID=UPI0009E1A664
MIWREFDHSKFKGLQVQPRSDENPEQTIRRFSRKVRDGQILRQYLDRRHHTKPSQRRKQKEARAAFDRRAEDGCSK